MNKTAKGAIAVVVTAALVYVAYKFIVKKPLSVPFEEQRQFIWDEIVKSIPAMAKLKDVYFKTEAYNDKDYIAAWYKAKKGGKDTFTYKGKVYNSKDGIAV